MLNHRRHILGSLNVVQLPLQLIIDVIEILPPVCLLYTLLPFLGYTADLLADLLVLFLLRCPLYLIQKPIFVFDIS